MQNINDCLHYIFYLYISDKTGFILIKTVCNTMLNMIFQCNWKLVFIQRILIGFEAILEIKSLFFCEIIININLWWHQISSSMMNIWNMCVHITLVGKLFKAIFTWVYKCIGKVNTFNMTHYVGLLNIGFLTNCAQVQAFWGIIMDILL